MLRLAHSHAVIALATIACAGPTGVEPDAAGSEEASTHGNADANETSTTTADGSSDASTSGGSAGGDPDVPPPTGPCLGVHLDEADCATLLAMRLPDALPPARGNAMADNEDAALLGHRLFFDSRLSQDHAVSCATCHEPAFGFGDARPTAVGIGVVPRNSQTVLDVARQQSWFWDGRADSLWSQPLGPLEHPAEMAFSRLAVAHRIAQSYAERYEPIFGALPPLEDAARFPAEGGPGSPAWESMTPEDRLAVTQIYVDVGKAMEAYMRRVVTGPAPFDRFLDGELDAISIEARRGIAVFFVAGCVQCHDGPLLSDQRFHNLGIVDADPTSALGRAAGLEALADAEFNAGSPWYDGGPPRDFPPPPPTAADLGAFRTPTLRNVDRGAPYGHDGSFETLADIVRFHLEGGGAGDPNLVGEVDPLLRPIALEDGEVADLLAFLETLDGTVPPLPWGDWPL